jgi:hypothetical protein
MSFFSPPPSFPQQLKQHGTIIGLVGPNIGPSCGLVGHHSQA